jgi:hypothetical protein
MTLPDERYRAVLYAKKFMEELIYDRKTYPRLPKIVRQRAAGVLRHYPNEWEMQQAAEAVPHVFAEKMEPVTRLFKQYEESKSNGKET